MKAKKMPEQIRHHSFLIVNNAVDYSDLKVSVGFLFELIQT